MTVIQLRPRAHHRLASDAVESTLRERIVGHLTTLLRALAHLDRTGPARLWVAAGCAMTTEALRDLTVELDGEGVMETSKAAAAAYWFCAAQLRSELAQAAGGER